MKKINKNKNYKVRRYFQYFLKQFSIFNLFIHYSESVTANVECRKSQLSKNHRTYQKYFCKNDQTARIILEKLTEDKRTNNHRLESIMRKRPIKIKSGKNTLIDKITSQGNPEGVSKRRLHLVLHVTPRDL